MVNKMINKWKHFYILFVLLIFILPSVNSLATIQWSEDNVTWTDFQTIDQTADTACENRLQADTLYYIRGREDNTSYQFIEQRTLPGGLDQMMLGVVIGLLVAIGFFSFLVVKIKGTAARFFFTSLAFIQLMILLYSITVGELTTQLRNLLTLNFKIMFLVAVGLLLYGVYLYVIKLINPDPVSVTSDDEIKWND